MESPGSNVSRARGDKPTEVKCSRCGNVTVLEPGADLRSLPVCSCRILRKPAPVQETP